MSLENICNEYFNCNISYIADFIMVYESRFRFDYKYDINNTLSDRYVRVNNDKLFQIYNSKDSILNGMISVTDSDSYRNFSKLLKIIIKCVIAKRIEQGEGENERWECYFSDSIQNNLKSDLLYQFDSETKFIEPNILSSKMVIKWIVLYIISRNCHNFIKNGDSFDLEDIRDFEFQYNDKDDSLHLLVYTRRNYDDPYPLSTLQKWHFIHIYTSRRNVLDLDDWYEFDENNNRPMEREVEEMVDAPVNYDPFNISKDFVDVKKKERMKKLLKLMILTQMMNNQNK